MLIKLIFSSLALRLLNVIFVAWGTFLLANILSLEDFGFYSLLLSYVALSTIPLQSSIPIINIRTISRNPANGIPFTLISSAFWVTIVYLAAVIMLDSILDITIGSPVSKFRIEFYLLTIVILFLSYLVSYIQGMNKIIVSQLIEQIARPFVFLLPILLVTFFNCDIKRLVTTYHIYFILIVSYLFSILIAFLYLIRGSYFSSITSTSELINHNWFRILLPLSSLSGLQVLLSQMDAIVLANIQGHEILAEYRIATQFSIALSMISTVVGGVIAPKINQLYNKDNKTLENLIYKMNWIGFFVGSAILLFYCFFSKWIVLRLLGDKYVSVYVLLLVLCAGQFISSLFGPISTIANMLSLERRNLVAILISVLFNLIALLILVPRYGGLGAAISTSTAMVFWKILLTFLVRNKINIVCYIRC